ncbi:MAG: hypothetical protein LBR68_06720 [Lachnoclostridium sp.]|jgi:hypothetical protein|nr:hypothetical protein [Lachnoclostridium sp.]
MNLIDIVTMPPKSAEASVQQNNTLRHSAVASEQAGKHFANEVQHNTQQATGAEKGEWTEFRYGDSGGNAGYRENQNKKKKKDEKEQPKAPLSDSIFDIKI